MSIGCRFDHRCLFDIDSSSFDCSNLCLHRNGWISIESRRPASIALILHNSLFVLMTNAETTEMHLFYVFAYSNEKSSVQTSFTHQHSLTDIYKTSPLNNEKGADFHFLQKMNVSACEYWLVGGFIDWKLLLLKEMEKIVSDVHCGRWSWRVEKWLWVSTLLFNLFACQINGRTIEEHWNTFAHWSLVKCEQVDENILIVQCRCFVNICSRMLMCKRCLHRRFSIWMSKDMIERKQVHCICHYNKMKSMMSLYQRHFSLVIRHLGNDSQWLKCLRTACEICWKATNFA